MFVGAWNAVSIVPEIWALLRVYGSVPALQKTLQSASSSSGNAFATLWAGWATYISSQRIFLVSFAYTLLYWTALRFALSSHVKFYKHLTACRVCRVSCGSCRVVCDLSPGALMSAYLLTHGINEIYIALYTGASSVVGMIPTFFTSTLFKRFGIEKTGTPLNSAPLHFQPSQHFSERVRACVRCARVRVRWCVRRNVRNLGAGRVFVGVRGVLLRAQLPPLGRPSR